MGTSIGKLDAQVAIEFDAQSGATSDLDLSDRVVGGHVPRRRRDRPMEGRRSFIVSRGFAASSTTCAFTHR
jgi:hypothetical protein